jgi:hypothetical protein
MKEVKGDEKAEKLELIMRTWVNREVDWVAGDPIWMPEVILEK